MLKTESYYWMQGSRPALIRALRNKGWTVSKDKDGLQVVPKRYDQTATYMIYKRGEPHLPGGIGCIYEYNGNSTIMTVRVKDPEENSSLDSFLSMYRRRNSR